MCLFTIFRKVDALSLHARCADVGTLSPTARCVDDSFSLFGKCAGGVLRAKNGASRLFSKVDEVEVYPYHLGEVAFGS